MSFPRACVPRPAGTHRRQSAMMARVESMGVHGIKMSRGNTSMDASLPSSFVDICFPFFCLLSHLKTLLIIPVNIACSAWTYCDNRPRDNYSKQARWQNFTHAVLYQTITAVELRKGQRWKSRCVAGATGTSGRWTWKQGRERFLFLLALWLPFLWSSAR